MALTWPASFALTMRLLAPRMPMTFSFAVGTIDVEHVNDGLALGLGCVLCVQPHVVDIGKYLVMEHALIGTAQPRDERLRMFVKIRA